MQKLEHDSKRWIFTSESVAKLQTILEYVSRD